MAFLLLFNFSPLVKAEYRAFLLKISKSEQDYRLVRSNLDPEQYLTYYRVKPNEIVSYIDTWMCRGVTSNKPVCPSPREPAQAPATSPAAIDQIRSQLPTN